MKTCQVEERAQVAAKNTKAEQELAQTLNVTRSEGDHSEHVEWANVLCGRPATGTALVWDGHADRVIPACAKHARK